MKTITTIIIFILGLQTTVSQISNNVTENYETVEIKPEYSGGINEFIKFIGNNFKLPDVESISGTVKVSYIIDIDGKLKDIKVLSDIGNGTGEEAIRVLKTCPNWTPGENDGKKVRVKMQLPINLEI